ncbi:hypothetical protein [Beggiatoa leptomitoformis]|uniref:Uncharacterized protein n=1 Tax=Beggiatoa leptomitoformis TaxID=288004 RepID=A0A2N9YHB9_9GAMM|nr:hypothetical protein [Beggiatoa leptomitoformis]ALG67876.1 hypothetical protein AL038_09335 [Beggiatoa leptomitoformis]AUI69863.1 hypothetical protein BLE401_14965 [Beggiatoa leptomitoformis]
MANTIITDYLAAKMRDHVLGIAPYSMPTSLRCALYLGDDGIQVNAPTEEVSDVNYAHQVVSFVGGSSTVNFPPLTIAYTPLYLGIIDFTVSKILLALPFTTPSLYPIGKPLYIPEGNITVSWVDGGVV